MSGPSDAREVLDAIRLAVKSTASDKHIVAVVRTLLADAPDPLRRDTRSVGRFVRAVKRARALRGQA